MDKSSRRLRPKRRLRILLVLLLIVAIMVSFYKSIFIFSLILVVASLLQFLTYSAGFKYNLGHVFFLSIIAARELGLFEGFALIILAGFVPKMLKNDIDLKSISQIPIEMFLVFLSTAVILPLPLMGTILSMINYSLMYLAAKFSGESIAEIITETALPFFMNLIYFLSMSGPIVSIISKFIAI
ncbi:MAG: hypothetical protein ABIJ34_09675 [archaeon]